MFNDHPDETKSRTLSDSNIAIHGDANELQNLHNPTQNTTNAMNTTNQTITELILQQSDHIYFVFDNDNHLLYSSPSLLRLLGYDSLPKTEDLIQWLHPEDRELVDNKYFLAKHNMRLTTSEIRFVDSGGITKWFVCNWSPFKNHFGEVMGIMVSLVDISARKYIEEKIQKTEDNFKSLFDSNIIGVTLSDLDGNIFVANDAILEMLGYTRGEFNSGLVKWTSITPPQYKELDERVTNQLKTEGRTMPFEKEYYRKDGSTIPVLVGLVKLRGETDQTICLIINLTQQKYLEQQLQYQALHDYLTGLPNRRNFLDTLTQTITRCKEERSSEYGLMFIDVDDFKAINDTYGHLVGDKALIILAEKLKHYLRKQDLVARLGGDEFVILFEDLSVDEVIAIANRIYRELNQPQLIDGNFVSIGVSIGITPRIDPFKHADELLKNADEAMYRAKSQGKGQYYILEQSNG